MSSRVALWVIAVCLVLLVAGGGTYAFVQWRGHQQDEQVKAERNKYRDQAELGCTLVGNLPPGTENYTLDQLEADPAYQRCVEREIDSLVANDGGSGF